MTPPVPPQYTPGALRRLVDLNEPATVKDEAAARALAAAARRRFVRTSVRRLADGRVRVYAAGRS